MKRIALLLATFLLTACSGHYQMMSKDQFTEVDIGTPVSVIEEQYGPPFAIHSKKPDQEVYEYLERVVVGAQTVQYKRYFFVISKDGKVIGKYVKVVNQAAYSHTFTNDPYETY